MEHLKGRSTVFTGEKKKAPETKLNFYNILAKKKRERNEETETD